MFELKLALIYLKRNKKESAAIIASLVIAITLILGVDIGSNSIQINQIEKVKQIEGYYEGALITKDKEDIEKLKEIDDIYNCNMVKDLGKFIPNTGLKSDLYTFDENYLKMLNYKLVQGRFPVKENEIVIDKGLIDQSLQKKYLGKDISAINKIEYNSNGVNEIYSKKNEYRVVGFISKVDEYYKLDDRSNQLSSFVKDSEDKLPEELMMYRALYNIKGLNENNFYQKISEITDEYNLKVKNKIVTKNNVQSEIYLNSYLETAFGNLKDQGSIDLISKSLLVIIAIFIIINFFSILLRKLTSQIGQLRLVGMSNKKVVLFYLIQIGILFSISCVVGFLFSIIFARYSMSVLVTLNVFDISKFNKVELNIPYGAVLKTVIIIGFVLFSTVMILILESLRKYPIDIINKSEKTKYKTKNNKKIIITLLKNNLLRKKSKTIISIILISLSGFFIIAGTATNLQYIREQSLQNSGSAKNKYNYIISPKLNADTSIKKISENDIVSLRKLKGVKDFALESYNRVYSRIEKNKLGKWYVENMESRDSNSNFQEIKSALKGVEDTAELNDFLEEGDLNKLNESNEEYVNIAICNLFYNIDSRKNESVIKDLKIGDTFNLKVENKSLDGNYYYKNIKVKVVAILEERYMLKNTIEYNSSMRICMNLKEFKKSTSNNYIEEVRFNAEKDNYNEINRFIRNIELNNKVLDTYEKNRPEFKVYFPIIICILVLLSALFNMYITIDFNIKNNIKEYSILRAIGLDVKALKKLVIYESITYSFLGSLIAIIAIAIKDFKYLAYIKERNLIDVEYKVHIKEIYMPPKEAIMYMLIMILVAFLVGYFKSKYISKMSIIDGINESDI